MSSRRNGPAELEGEALRRWYLRSPDEIESERNSAGAARYREFFGRDPSGAGLSNAAERGADGEDLWIATGNGGYRKAQRPKSDFHATLEPTGGNERPAYLPEHSAVIEEGGLQDVGNPHNPRLRREWEVANGRPWPRMADGRPYDVAHIRAIADGGANTLDNIRPLHPAEHRAGHKLDAIRWGKRAGIARAFGGKVEPPAHAPRAKPRLNGFGALGLFNNLTGLLSGRIRTDTPEHVWYDLGGFPAPGDEDQDIDPACRALGNPKPGLKCT